MQPNIMQIFGAIVVPLSLKISSGSVQLRAWILLLACLSVGCTAAAMGIFCRFPTQSAFVTSWVGSVLQAYLDVEGMVTAVGAGQDQRRRKEKAL